MTQFALAASKNSSSILVPVKTLGDDFILEIAEKLFPDTPVSEIFTLDMEGKYIDQIMLDSQKAIGSLEFKNTELYEVITSVVSIVDELVFWYGSYYDDLDYVYDASALLSKLEGAINDSACELYVRYTGSKLDR